MSPGESVRESYRKQGADRTVDKVIHNLTTDAVISTSVDVRLLERIVRIVEASK